MTTSAPSGRATVRRLRGEVVALGALASFGPLSIDMYLPGLPQLGRSLGASASAAQLTLTACLAGLALGQLVIGPLSDRVGRRLPLITGVSLYLVGSLLCAIAPSILVLIPLRFLQGLAGSAGIVLTRAMVRDHYSGEAAARRLAGLMVINGLAPILAPIIGGQLLHVMTWRGVFLVLAGISLALLGAAAWLGETLAPDRRHRGGLGAFGRALAEIAGDRVFVGHGLAGGFVLGAMFAYIAGSPFVLQDIYGLSPQAFSLVFALNGAGVVLATLLVGRLIPRWSLGALERAGVALCLLGAAVLMVALGSRGLGVAPVLVGLFTIVFCVGVLQPTSTALALERHGQVAGSASALLGVFQYILGAVAAPLVGLAGKHSAIPMGVLIVLLSLGAALALVPTLGRGAGRHDGVR